MVLWGDFDMIAARRDYGEAGGFPCSSIVEECRLIQEEALDITKRKARKRVRKALVKLTYRRQELIDTDCWHQPENAERVWVDHLLGRLASLLGAAKKKS